jgi:hypothetical protein
LGQINHLAIQAESRSALQDLRPVVTHRQSLSVIRNGLGTGLAAMLAVARRVADRALCLPILAAASAGDARR